MALKTSDESTNYSRMWDLTQVIIDLSRDLLDEYINDLSKIDTGKAKLDGDQKNTLNDIPIRGNFDTCDFSLLYILMRNNLPTQFKPTKGWGKANSSSTPSPGDDIEQFRVFRNNLAHSATRQISNADYNSMFKEFKYALERFDDRHGGLYILTNKGSYVDKLERRSRLPLDHDLDKHINQKLETKLESVEESITENVTKAVETKFESMEKSITENVTEAVETKLESVEESITENVTKEVETKFESMEKSITENVTEAVESKVESINETLRQELKTVTEEVKAMKIQEGGREDTASNMTHKERETERETEEEPDEEELDDNEFIEDDGTPHLREIKGFHVYCHQTRQRKIDDLFKSFCRNDYLKTDEVQVWWERGVTSRLSHTEFDKKLEEKFYQMFCNDMHNKSFLVTNADKQDCFENNDGFYDFCKNQIEKYCMRKNSFFFIDYSIEENLEMLEFDLTKLKKRLKVNSKEQVQERVLVYLADSGILLNIRYFNSAVVSVKTIADVIKQGHDEIKLLSALFFEILREGKITILNLVAIPEVTKEKLITCSPCNCLFLTKHEISNDRMFENVVDTLVNNVGRQLETAPSDKTFIRLASQIWGFLSLEDVHLPSVSRNTYNTLSRLYLNKVQRYFLHSRYKHVVIQGAYGSGKSVLAQIKFNRLVKNGKNDYVYFICFSYDTLYINSLRSRMLSGPDKRRVNPERVTVLNVSEYAEKYKLEEPLLLSDILDDLIRRHNNSNENVHVIIDEYDGASNLRKWECQRICKSLGNMKDSFVWVICQSMHTDRERLKMGERRILFPPKCTRIPYNSYKFEETGMEIKVLNHIMRNTIAINRLSRVAKGLLQGSTNVYKDPNEPQVSVGSKRSLYKTFSIQEDETPKASDNEKKVSSANGLKSTSRKKMSCTPSMHFDHVMKQVNHVPLRGNDKIATTFRFTGDWCDGHLIEGEKPLLIYPFADEEITYQNVNKPDIVFRLLYVVKELIKISSGKQDLCIICFDVIDVQLYESVLKAMQIPVKVYAPALGLSTEEHSMEDLTEVLKSHVIITDHIGCRGMEYAEVVVSIDPNEFCLHQYLIEALTRCLNNLSFTVFKKGTDCYKEKQSKTCKDIIEQWNKEKLVDKHVVKICNEVSHKHFHDVKCQHGIHIQHEYFQRFELEPIEVVEFDQKYALKQYQVLTSPEHQPRDVWQRHRWIREFAGKSLSYVEKICREKNDKEFSNVFESYKDDLLSLRDDNGNSCLHVAAMNDFVEPIQLMLDYGMNINDYNVDGCTPLMTAASVGSKNVIEYLIIRGADVTCDAINSSCDFEIVEMVERLSRQRFEMCRKYEEAGFDDIQKLIHAEDKHMDIIISRKHPVTEMRNRFDESLLHIAARYGKPFAVKSLLRGGIDIHWKNEQGLTALDMAKIENHKECVFLIEQWLHMKGMTDIGKYRDLSIKDAVEEHMRAMNNYPKSSILDPSLE